VDDEPDEADSGSDRELELAGRSAGRTR